MAGDTWRCIIKQKRLAGHHFSDKITDIFDLALQPVPAIRLLSLNQNLEQFF